MTADKARAKRRHEKFGELWAFVGGRGPSKLDVPVNEDTAPALEGLWALVNYRINLRAANGNISRKRAGKKLKGWHSSSLNT